MSASTWLAEATAVFVKEWRSELRTRYALNTFGLFAVTTLITASVALGPASLAPVERASVLPVLLWLILLFTATAGLPRAFVFEEETHTSTALRLAASPGPLFVGKAAYNLALTLALEALVVPLFLILFDLAVASPGLLALALLAGGFGLALGSTLVSALISQARGRGTLFAVLSLPILLPLLLFSVQLTRLAILGDAPGQTAEALLLYDASLTVASMMLFPVIWNP